MQGDWKSVAGTAVGKDKHEVVFINETSGETFTMRIRGRNLYCKKARRLEEIDGIVIPDKSRDDHTWATVLAIGEGCGEFHKLSSAEKKMVDMRPSVGLGVNPYDMVLGPDNHPWGIAHSPYVNGDYFLHECIVKAVMPQGKDNAI